MGEKRVMIGSDCGVFVVANSVSSLGDDGSRRIFLIFFEMEL